MKILMTGASGPKTGATVAKQLARHHAVIGVDLVPGHCTQHLLDVTHASESDWRPFLDGVDAVVHFAALHAPHRETHSRGEFFQTNVEATNRLINAAKQAGVRRFLLASSTSVYGKSMRPSGTKAIWVTEALVPEPEDIYDETKLAAEQLVRIAFAPDFVTASLRFSRSFPEPIPLMALYRLYRGVDARDVAQAFAKALTAQLTQFEALNVSAATPFVESDCAALLNDAPAVLQQRCPAFVAAFAQRGWALPQTIDRVYVVARARQVLGYEPAYAWRDALGETA